MTKRLLYFFITGALLFAAFSCGKTGSGIPEELHEIDNNDDVYPVITVLRPAVNQVFTSGDSIIVEGSVTDNKKLYKGKVQIINDQINAVAAEQFYESHFLQVINFRVAYKATVSSSADFSIYAEFEDHGQNKSTKTFKVKVNP